MRTRKTKRIVTAAVLALVLGALWFAFAPSSIGGSADWVVTDGISMEPRFHSGDLVLVRPQGEYRVGEIVAYHSKVFHTVVLHRIVGRDGPRFVFKGDNNSFYDFEHPAKSQLIGALWIHLPGLGADLESVHSPAVIGGLGALATLLFAGAAFTSTGRRRRRERRSAAVARPRSFEPQGAQLAVLAGGLALIAPFAVLAVLSFTRPANALVRTELPFEQRGTLSYSAHAGAAHIYPGNVAKTGDPLFTKVLDQVQLRFHYTLSSPEAAHVKGRIAILATVESSAGWRTTLPLGATTSFTGTQGVAQTSISLRSLLALLTSVENSTGVRSLYTLTIEPQVHARGSLGGLPLHAGFSPTLGFSLNPLELQPLGTGVGGASSAKRLPPEAFTRRESSTASGLRSKPTHLAIGPLEPTVAAARLIAIVAILLATAAIGAGLLLSKPRRREQAAAIRARYGGLIIPVERVWQQPGVSVIDVADIEALVRIAAHYDRSILHELVDGGEAFWVSDESGQFRYWIPSAGAGDAADPGRVATLETLGWPEPQPETDGSAAPTMEFRVQAPGSPVGWGGGESVVHVDTSATNEHPRPA